MSYRDYAPKYTLADYRLWQGDWELIYGSPVAMSPSAVRNHQKIGVLISNQILKSFHTQEESCDGCDVVYELDWIVNDTTVVRPDVAVICDEVEDFITKPPVMIVEILSPSTALKDKHVKYELYQDNNVKYYFIVDTRRKTNEAFELVDGKYRDTQSTVFHIHSGCEVSLDLGEILRNMKD